MKKIANGALKAIGFIATGVIVFYFIILITGWF